MVHPVARLGAELTQGWSLARAWRKHNNGNVEIILADSLNVVDLLKADIVLIEQPALARMEEVYA